MSPVSRLLPSAQARFLLCLGVCATLDSRGLGNHHGWSYPATLDLALSEV